MTRFIFATGYGEMRLRISDRDQLRVDKPYFAPTIPATVAAALKAAG